MVRGKSESMVGSGMPILSNAFVCLGVCSPMFGREIGEGLLNLRRGFTSKPFSRRLKSV